MGRECNPYTRSVLLASSVLLLLFLFGCPGAPGAGAPPAGGAPAGGGAAAAPAAKNYDAIAVWQHKGSTFDIWYSIWDHAKKKWAVPSGKTSEAIAADAGDDHDADVSSNDNSALAVWSKVSGGASAIYYSIWQNDAWGSPATVSEGKADSDPTVAMEPSGSALAVWVADGGKSLYYSFYKKGRGWSQPGGVNLEGVEKVSLPETAFSPSDGKYYLVFTGTKGGKTSAYGADFEEKYTFYGLNELSSSSVLDNSVPTDQRTGIAAGKKGEVTAVYPGADGAAYSEIYGAGAAKKFGDGSMPDDAYDSADVANGAFSGSSDLYHQPNVNSPAAAGVISPLKSESRPSLTFIRERKVGLVVWWTASVAPGEIFYSYNEGGSWSSPKDLDPSLKGELDRNPAVTPLKIRAQVREPYCGDGILQPPEQCEAGIACPKAGDVCNLATCKCSPPKNQTYCGDKVIQAPEQCEVGIPCPKANQACLIPPCLCKEPPYNETVTCAENTRYAKEDGVNWYPLAKALGAQLLCKDDCKAKLGDEYECEPDSCICEKKPGTPQNKTVSCAQNTKAVNEPAGLYQQGMLCRDDCAALNKYWVCDPEGCFCKETRVVTPRCGDGYVSGPNTPGGGFEECDVGYGFYQPKDAAGKPITKPDTCPPPLKCDPPTCKCKPPITENITTGNQTQAYHNVCDYERQACVQVAGAGESQCSSNSQCARVTAPFCGNNMREGNEQCDGSPSGCDYGQSCNSQCQCYTPYIPPASVCGNGVKEAGEACDSNSDCVQQFGGQSVSGTCSEGCTTCRYNLYCGDGIVYGNEQCEQNSQCSQGYICSGCLCVPPPTHNVCSEFACVQVQGAWTSQCSTDADCRPPVVDCPAYCSGQGYSQVLQGTFANQQACSAAAQETPQQCTTQCIYTKFYSASNQAGTTTCCCKEKRVFQCSDCPGQNPVCPDPDVVCPANTPGGG